VQEFEGLPIGEGAWSADWLFYVLVLPLLLYALVIYHERYPAIWLSKVVYSNRFASNAYRNRTYGRQLGHSLLLLISLISLSTFCYFMEVKFELYFFGLERIALWFFNLGILSASVLGRFIILLLLGKITGTKDAFNEYGFNIAQFYKFLSVPLLLINFFIPYLESLPDIVLIIIALLFMSSVLIIRLLRLASIFIKSRFSLFYYILYLCALEFTPVMVFIKYLSGAV